MHIAYILYNMCLAYIEMYRSIILQTVCETTNSVSAGYVSENFKKVLKK